MLLRLSALLLLAFLASCSRVDDPQVTPRLSPLAAAAQPQVAITGQAIEPAVAAEQLLDYAEYHFGQYFPGNQVTKEFQGYLYRYYPDTKAYLGVKDGNVFTLGGPFGDTIRPQGRLTDFVTPGPPADRIEVTPSNVVLTDTTRSTRLSVRAFDREGREILGRPIWFTSSAPNQIRVDREGVVTALLKTGSSILGVRVGSMNSSPVLVGAVELKTNTQTVTDRQITSIVAIDVATAAGVTPRFEAVLNGVPELRTGSLLMSTETGALAGRVLEVKTGAGGETRVILERVRLNEIISNASISGRFTSNQILALLNEQPAQGVGRRVTTMQATRAASALSGPIPCSSPDVDPSILKSSLIATLTPDLDFTFNIDISDGQARTLILRYDGNIVAEIKGTLTLGALRASVNCDAILARIPIPLTGPLAAFFSPIIPIGATLNARVEASSSQVLGVAASITTAVSLGVESGIGGGRNINKLTSSGSLEVTPTLAPSPALRVRASIFGGVKAGLTAGNVLLSGPTVFDLVGGVEASSVWGGIYDSAVDTLFNPDYKIVAKGKISPGSGLIELLDTVKLLNTLDLSASLEVPIAHSPIATSLRVDRDAYLAGERVNFRLNIDPSSSLLPLSSGSYNIDEVRVYRIDRRYGTSELITAIPAPTGSTEFSASWIPLEAGETNGVQTFSAFLVPRLFTTGRIDFPVELGQFLAPSHLISPREVTLYPGDSTRFTAQKAGLPFTDVSWSQSGGTISASGTYTAGSEAGTFVVRGRDNTTGDLATAKVAIVLGQAPTIVSGPRDATIQSGESTQFSITISGTLPYSIQWFVNDVAVACQDAACQTWQHSPASILDSGKRIRATVRNRFGTVSSTVAILTVLPIDKFAGWGSANPAVPSVFTSTTCDIGSTAPQSYTPVGEFKVYAGDCIASLTLTESEWTAFTAGLSIDTGSVYADNIPRRFSLAFKDSFDFLLVILDEDVRREDRPYGIYTGFDVRLPIRKRRLLGAIYLPYAGSGSDVNSLRDGPILHEFLHEWANFNIIPNPGDPGHWGYASTGGHLGGYYAPSGLKALGGNRWQGKGPPRICLPTATPFELAEYCSPRNGFGTFANRGSTIPYSPFELFVMGLIPREEAPTITYAVDGTPVDPEAGIFAATQFKEITPSEVILKLGARAPNPTTSQRNFRIATLIVTRSSVLSVDRLKWFNYTVQEFSRSALPNFGGNANVISLHNFYTATSGHATMQGGGLLSERR